MLFLLACTQANAASFYCDQARTIQEKLICKSEEISKLDTQLGEAFSAAKLDANAKEAKRLTAEQLRWLRNVRNRCTDTACLRKTYKSRLNELDPFADDNLTCGEMKKFPERVFSGGIDLGSGTGSPIDVDYRCPESLSVQKFMQKLLSLAEQIRGEDGPQVCTGSIVHALWRYYHFSLAEAGFSPNTLSRRLTSIHTGMDWKSFARAEGSDEDNQVIQYFKQWSERSRFNQDLFEGFIAEFDRVLPALVRYYEEKFGLSRPDAQIAAGGALMLVVQRAAGSFPQSELQPESVFVQLARNGRTTPEEIRRVLGENKNDYYDPYFEDEVYQALRVALIHNRPLPIVSSFADMLPQEAFEQLGRELEPLLSLAIGSQPNLEYLLSRKVPVNAANDFGKTALFYAIGANNHKAAEALMQSGANVNHAYKSASELRPDGDACIYPGLIHTKRTPLMHAAQHSDVKMLKLLIQAESKLDAVDDLGFNALDYAVLGKKKDNEIYLKSLGLEFGAPQYSSEADPAVREHTIQKSAVIDGYVSKLAMAPGRPDILVASVHPWDTLEAGGTHGLYLISIANPDQPKVVATLAAIYVTDFALSPDGKRAYVMETSHNKSPPDKEFGLSIVDIDHPEKPVITERIEGDFMTMHLSPDGSLLYLQERRLKPAFSRGLLVYGVGSDGAGMKCSNPFGKTESDRPIFAYSFVSFPDAPSLLIHDQSGELFLFDVKDPCAPARLAEIRAKEMGGPMFGAAGRTLIVSGAGELQKFHITDTLVRVTGYQASVREFHVNATTGNITAVIGNDAAVFGTNPKGRFELTDRIRLPVKYVGGVLQTNSGHVYIGWKGGLGVGFIFR
ncbi:hypothetical protein GCM10027343_12420 [Noviherbaspirillum agri]